MPETDRQPPAKPPIGRALPRPRKREAPSAGKVLGLVGGVTLGTALIGALLFTLITGQPLLDDREEHSYTGGEGIRLKAWVIHGKGAPSDPRPAVLWFHGGGWRVGSPMQFAPQARALAKDGITSVLVEYRVQSRHQSTPFDSTADARAALRWVFDHASDLTIDPQHIAVGGSSAGGQLALTTALPQPPEPGGPAALILFHPVVDFDIPRIRQETTAEELENLRSIAPLHLFEGALPPTLLIQGEADPIVPLDSVLGFADKVQSQLPDRLQLQRYPGRDHEFYHKAVSKDDFRKTLGDMRAFLQSMGWIEKTP